MIRRPLSTCAMSVPLSMDYWKILGCPFPYYRAWGSPCWPVHNRRCPHTMDSFAPNVGAPLCPLKRPAV